MKNIDFTKLDVGTKVWSVGMGWGTIDSIEDGVGYTIEVKYINGNTVSFTSNGKLYSNDKYPALFLDEFKIPEEAYEPPRPDLKVDDKVLVWDIDGEDKQPRHFAKWSVNGKIICFDSGKTSWTAGDVESKTYWQHYEIPESE